MNSQAALTRPLALPTVLPAFDFALLVGALEKGFSTWRHDLSARRALKALARQIESGHVVLETWSEGFESSSLRQAALDLVAAAPSLDLRITTKGPALLVDLERLIEIDRDHVITVDVALAAEGQDLVFGLVAELASNGLAARLVLTEKVAELEQIFQVARRIGAADVVAALELGDEEAETFAGLRVAYGFPTCVPGRG